MTGAPVDPEVFARTFVALLDWAKAAIPATDHPLVTRIREYLTGEARERSVVARGLSPFDQVNQQFALDVWMAEPGRTVVVEGLSVPPDHPEPALHDLLRGGGGSSPLRVGAPDLRYSGTDHHGFDDGVNVRRLTVEAVAPFLAGPNAVHGSLSSDVADIVWADRPSGPS